MEVKINREILSYTENLFFGLSLRQCIFSFLAIGVAVGIYFLLHETLGRETTGWLCIVSAFPFALLGFVKYNAMTAEQFLLAWLRSELLLSKKLLFVESNYYYHWLRSMLEVYQKEGKNQDDKDHEKAV